MESFREKSAPQGALRDGSSRHNASQSEREIPSKRGKSGTNENRESISEYSKSIMGSTTPRSLHRTYSEPNGWNRGDVIRAPSPARDRRAMLEDWRRRKGRHVSDTDSTSRKRVKRIPSSSRTGYHSSNDLSQESYSSSDAPYTSSLQSIDDRGDNHSTRRNLVSCATPGRGKLGSARRGSLFGKSVPRTPPEGKYQLYGLSLYN